MKKILHIISSPRGDASFSIQLGKAIVEKLLAEYPGSTVKETNLVNVHFPHLEEVHLASFFTPAESRSPELRAAVSHSDDAIRDILEADILVIGAPMYNFTIHSALKAWLDHIVRAGVTFRYDENGLHGLITGKKAYLAFTAGGVYSEGPLQPIDFVTPYLKTVLGHLGITDVTTFRIEGTNIPGVKETAVEKGLAEVQVG